MVWGPSLPPALSCTCDARPSLRHQHWCQPKHTTAYLRKTEPEQAMLPDCSATNAQAVADVCAKLSALVRQTEASRYRGRVPEHAAVGGDLLQGGVLSA